MGKLCPLRKTPRFAKYRDKEFLDKSRVLYIKDTVLLIPNNWSSNTFYSSFFKSCNYYAYDGDNIYKIDIPNEIFNEYNIIKNACTVLLFFKRGEIPISPTRESIEINNFTNDWIKGKFKSLIKIMKRLLMIMSINLLTVIYFVQILSIKLTQKYFILSK